MRQGQHALLRSGLQSGTTPEIDGSVERVSADVTTDPKTGASHYTLRILVSQAEKDRSRRRTPRPRHAGRGVLRSASARC